MDNLLPHQNLSLEDMDGEIWKDIEGFEGYFKISNLGRIKSLSWTYIGGKYNSLMTKKEFIRKISFDKIDRYYKITLKVNKKEKRKMLHRLIAQHFIDNPLNKSQVNHIDGVRTNYKLENLEWVTSRENVCHGKTLKKIKTSIYTGVYKEREDKYISNIWHNGKKIRIGSFKTEQEAYQSRCEYEKNNNIENKYL